MKNNIFKLNLKDKSELYINFDSLVSIQEYEDGSVDNVHKGPAIVIKVKESYGNDTITLTGEKYEGIESDFNKFLEFSKNYADERPFVLRKPNEEELKYWKKTQPSVVKNVGKNRVIVFYSSLSYIHDKIYTERDNFGIRGWDELEFFDSVVTTDDENENINNDEILSNETPSKIIEHKELLSETPSNRSWLHRN